MYLIRHTGQLEGDVKARGSSTKNHHLAARERGRLAVVMAVEATAEELVDAFNVGNAGLGEVTEGSRGLTISTERESYITNTTSRHSISSS